MARCDVDRSLRASPRWRRFWRWSLSRPPQCRARAVQFEFHPRRLRQGVREPTRQEFLDGAVFVGGVCLFGLLPHLATLLESRGAGSIREAGFVISGFALGGVAYALAVRRILSSLGGQMNMIRVGGVIAALGFTVAALSHSGRTWPPPGSCSAWAST